MVDRSEVDQMTKFMQALNADTPATDRQPTGAAKAVGLSPNSRQAMTQDMRLILERFHRAADRVGALAHDDSDLKEAMITERTASGSRIGTWEIRAHQNGKRSTYDVAQVGHAEGIVCDLTLYEAAHGLVRILNGGGKVNSSAALELMQAENAYASALRDAVLFKHRLQNDPPQTKATIYEARYSNATRRALVARDRVMTLSEQRR